jgi:hypothetical protein
MKPWTEGPLELLMHGADHLRLNTDFDNRIAMISIDNAIELMIKTYLSLPRRVTGISGLSRNRRDEAFRSFPSLLDALEEFALDKIVGIELSDIEWYHRLRNQLYHDGNGITVENTRVHAYCEIARILFANLFGDSIEEVSPDSSLSGFIGDWSNVEHELTRLQAYHNIPDSATYQFIIEWLEDSEIVPPGVGVKFRKVKRLRDQLVHSTEEPDEMSLRQAGMQVKELLKFLKGSYKAT